MSPEPNAAESWFNYLFDSSPFFSEISVAIRTVVARDKAPSAITVLVFENLILVGRSEIPSCTAVRGIPEFDSARMKMNISLLKVIPLKTLGETLICIPSGAGGKLVIRPTAKPPPPLLVERLPSVPLTVRIKVVRDGRLEFTLVNVRR